MHKPWFLLIFLAFLASSCSFPGVYKLDIPQGNVVKQDMIDQLEIGMTKRQVRYVMGTPLVIDSFNPDRWDYYFSHKDREENFREHRMTLYFEQGKLVRIDNRIPPPEELGEVVEAPEDRITHDDKENNEQPKETEAASDNTQSDSATPDEKQDPAQQDSGNTSDLP